MKRGTLEIECIVFNCDFTSVTDCRLNQRKTVAPGPCDFSRAFSIHKEKLFSITLNSDYCPDFVIYLVMYSMTASFVRVTWKSILDSMAKSTNGT